MLKKVALLMLGAGLLPVSSAVQADARGFSMAGAGVANGNPTQAAALNPALLAHKTDTEQFSLTFPSFALQVNNPDDVMGPVRDIQSIIEEMEELAEEGELTESAFRERKDSLAERIRQIGGEAAVDGQAYGQLAFPGDKLALGIFFSAQPGLITRVMQHPEDPEIIEQASELADLDSLRSEGIVIGNMVMETGMVVAADFSVRDGTLAIGIAPKLQRIDAFAYYDRLNNFSDRYYDESGYYRNETAFNVDVGMTWYQGSWQSGLSIRNLMNRSVSAPEQQTTLFGEQGTLDLTYEFRPEVTAAIGYRYDNWTFAADLDVNKRRYLALSSEAQQMLFSDIQYVQFARIGVVNNHDSRWQWRGGVRADLHNTYDTAVTGGVAFTVFNWMSVDLGLLYAGKRNVGGSMQLAFNF